MGTGYRRHCPKLERPVTGFRSISMHLVMFDIDGTLTETCAVDSDCFARAVSQTLGLADIDTDWTRYRHVTDSGIADEIVRRSLGRAPHDGELDEICDVFVRLLGESFISGAPCRAIAGAAGVLDALSARPDVAVALATGGWERS